MRALAHALPLTTDGKLWYATEKRKHNNKVILQPPTPTVYEPAFAGLEE